MEKRHGGGNINEREGIRRVREKGLERVGSNFIRVKR